jgi:hypothetical protein
MAIQAGKNTYFTRQSGGVDHPQEVHYQVRYTGNDPTDITKGENMNFNVPTGHDFPGMVTIKRLPK